MYKYLLTIRYFRRKIIAVFAVFAVLLCTAMVIIVSSVMGGFLDLLKDAGKTMVGDVAISGGLAGFAHYDDVIKELSTLTVDTPQGKTKAVFAATPVIQAYGLLKLPGNRILGIEVMGIKGQSQSKVTGYDSILFWNNKRFEDPHYAKYKNVYQTANLQQAGVSFKSPFKAGHPGIVPGLEVSPYNGRNHEGAYDFHYGDGAALPGRTLTLTILPISAKGATSTIDAETQQFTVVNEFMSGLYVADSKRTYIDFDIAQRMTQMQPAKRVLIGPDGPILDDEGNVQYAGTVPGRCTDIYIKAAPGVTPDQLKVVVKNLILQMQYEKPLMGFPIVRTWMEQQRQFYSAVEKEKSMMTFLFGIISIVAIVMVGVIFYMIVLEKTKDIGILRSIGASKLGTMAIFLIYGAVIGIVGGVLGVLTGYLVITNINSIHAWLGNGMGASAFVALCSLVLPILILIYWVVLRIQDIKVGKWIRFAALAGWGFGLLAALIPVLVSETFQTKLNQALGFTIWDSRVYFFDSIPSTLDPFEVSVIFGIAVFASIIGALIPAFKAAQVDPVNALRYE